MFIFLSISWRRFRKKLQVTNVIMRLAVRLLWLDIPLYTIESLFSTPGLMLAFPAQRKNQIEIHSALGVITHT